MAQHRETLGVVKRGTRAQRAFDAEVLEVEKGINIASSMAEYLYIDNNKDYGGTSGEPEIMGQ